MKGSRKNIPLISIVPELSESTSCNMSWSSPSVGFKPRERMTSPSSAAEISPVFLLLNASSVSLVCVCVCVQEEEDWRVG